MCSTTPGKESPLACVTSRPENAEFTRTCLSDAFVDQTRCVYFPNRDDATSLACVTSRPDTEAPILSIDAAVHENVCFQPSTCDVTFSHVLLKKIQCLRLPLQELVADLHESSCLVEDLSEQGQWSSNRHRFQNIHVFTDGSHNPQSMGGKRLGWALAVLAEMCDGEWAFLGAQAASECHDPVKYDLIGDSSHNSTELLAAGPHCAFDK